ncbi:3-oxoacyl-(acyl-carrier protein) reductase [Colletotrichum nymphaeae SA-01]|uniref:3-oxoacyl-(Acyl-carrier protein) reductase n=1 Tax=Colletotrichum nymphaeae SA-01 TaxID=1460502 RepID=A0A135THJ2_9PEZI|nr:3-oxoacyl-(acyl-carrier protein) reductase [Colletotrichum nymphaeae SA-01]
MSPPVHAPMSPRGTMMNKVALVSGSSKGIGAGIAMELSSRGANIVLNYPWGSLKQECEATGAKLQTDWIAVCADLTSDDGPEELVRQAVARFGHIDILVSNAGYVPIAHLWDADLSMWDQAMNLNARGAFALVKAALPHLTPYKPADPPNMSGAIGGSRIIMVGSAASRVPKPTQGIYAATKGALDAILRVWAKELPPKYGCTVNMVAPGPVLTESFLEHFSPKEWEGLREVFIRDTPVEGGAASVEDVAWAVAFLAEERSRFINGEYMFVTGGVSMQ